MIGCISTGSMQWRVRWIQEISIENQLRRLYIKCQMIYVPRLTECVFLAARGNLSLDLAVLDFEITHLDRTGCTRYADQSIGNDFFDFGGGNSRSRSVRSSFVNLILREATLSRTCASVLAFGIAITSGWRNTHASAIWAGVASWDCAIFFSAAFLSNVPL